MIEHGKLNGYLVAINEELRKAEGKHPKFCDHFIDESTRTWAEAEFRIKAKNMTDCERHADNILMEEMAKAFNAYSQGKLEESLQEFAQCGAVILRCMQFVRDELNGGKK